GRVSTDQKVTTMITATALPGAASVSQRPANGAAAVAAEAEHSPVARGSPARIDPDLDALMQRYPVGSQVKFRAYHPAIWPRDWRRVAERAAWGLRRDQLLQVIGYGSACNFP